MYLTWSRPHHNVHKIPKSLNVTVNTTIRLILHATLYRIKISKVVSSLRAENQQIMTSVDDEWRHGSYHYRQCQRAWRHGGGVVAEVTRTFTCRIRAFYVGVLELLVITRTNDCHDLIYSIRWWQLASCLIYSYALIEYINRFAVDGMVTFFFTILT